MTYEVSKQFRFEAAHTLARMIDAESSKRIHGHSYRAEVTLRGEIDPATGMLVDLGSFDLTLQNVRSGLDHRFLNEVEDLGPATMENLARWIWQRVSPCYTNLARVTVHRDSTGESCSYFGPNP